MIRALCLIAELFLGLLACHLPDDWRMARHAVGSACVVNARVWWVAEQRLIEGGQA